MSGSQSYLLIREDGSIEEARSWSFDWADEVRAGTLDVVRFDASEGCFERYEPDSETTEWLELQ